MFLQSFPSLVDIEAYLIMFPISFFAGHFNSKLETDVVTKFSIMILLGTSYLCFLVFLLNEHW